MKKTIGFMILGFITLGLISQLLIYTGIIPEKSAEPGVSIPTSTITPKPSIKPNIDPWTQYSKFKVDWREYSVNFELLLKEKFDNKDCNGMQSAFDALVIDNKDHAMEYGHNNVAMMSFVDYLLKASNCYK
jgi:hypothetical protein